MSLTLDLTPEEETRLRRIAASVHQDAEAYAVEIIRRMIRDETLIGYALGTPAGESLSEDVRQRIQRIHNEIRAMGLKDVPFYPDDVMTREWIYGDHP